MKEKAMFRLDEAPVRLRPSKSCNLVPRRQAFDHLSLNRRFDGRKQKRWRSPSIWNNLRPGRRQASGLPRRASIFGRGS
jgi:hypothetical protein